MRTQCPACRTYYKVDESKSGTTANCPKCNCEFTISASLDHTPSKTDSTQSGLEAGGGVHIPGSCPVCSNSKHMRDPRLLYGHIVCRKCYYAFANRRQLAYLLDFGAWFVLLITPAMVASASRQREALAIVSDLAVVLWLVWPVLFLCKDCFSGQSIGKMLCGVAVVDQRTGKRGGVLASFIRNLSLVVPFMPLVVAGQLCRGYRTGDRSAHTKVLWIQHASSPVFASSPEAEQKPSVGEIVLNVLGGILVGFACLMAIAALALLALKFIFLASL